ncbi:MAG: hemerythrin family protein [Candidatus Omnitrophica bacterium]|nr:hemerythrin family protein [Candidatus Omnitrophota bacterium]
MILWQESYSTGVAELDKQHKALFQCTNELGKAIEDNALSPRIIDETLIYLKKYIQVHFGHEETCMHRFACPIATKNKEAHEKFIQKFKTLEEKIKSDETKDEPIIELHHFLETWLVDHIGRIDTQIKPCAPPQSL